MRRMRSNGWMLLCGVSMTLGACRIETPSLESLSCEADERGEGTECVEGRWVASQDISMLPVDMSELDAALDMPVVVDMPDVPDMSDLGDPCSAEHVASLCREAQCGAPQALKAQCPGEACADTCSPSQQCVDTSCIACLDLGEEGEGASPEVLCTKAAEALTANVTQMPAVQCGPGARPAVKICELTTDVDCQGVCPGELECGVGGVCCVSAAQTPALCEQLTVAEACGLIEPARRVYDCETGDAVALHTRCETSCPFFDARQRGVVTGQSAGVGEMIGEHTIFPALSTPLSTTELEFWLRPSDSYFMPAQGRWTALTGSANDMAQAMLYDANSLLIASMSDTTLRRSDTRADDKVVNFNPYVDLEGGFITFDRPADFKDDVSLFMVVRNKVGDEIDVPPNEEWYQRPAVLSGEHAEPSLDFGVTLNQGRFEWSPNSSDAPAVQTSNVYRDPRWHVLAVTRKEGDSHGNSAIYVDGELGGKGKMGQGSFGTTTVRVGRQPAPWESDGQWHGDVAEVMMYSKEMDTEERRRIQSYLAIKYGITLKEDYTTQDRTLYDVSVDGSNRIFGVMCDDDFALRQHTSASRDELWELRSDNLYSGLGDCPLSPERFSVLMGDDDGGLVVANDPVNYASTQGNAFELDLEVIERTWTMRITQAEASKFNFTLTLNASQSDFVSSGFRPEMLLLTDRDGVQYIVPMRKIGELYVVAFEELSASGLALDGALRLQLARFTR